MQMETEKQADTLWVAASGEIDLREAERLRRTADPLLPGCRHLVLDLSGVVFIDSSGVGSIIGRYRRIREQGGDMAIVGAKGGVKKVLEFSGIPNIIRLYPAREALPREFRGGKA